MDVDDIPNHSENATKFKRGGRGRSFSQRSSDHDDGYRNGKERPRRQSWLSRIAFVVILFLFAVLAYVSSNVTEENLHSIRSSSAQSDSESSSSSFEEFSSARKKRHSERQKAIVDEALWSWNGYVEYAWGWDELKPLSKSGGNWFGVGLTLVDSLDTLLIMGLDAEFERAKQWVATELRFDIDVQVNLFETTIRILGGLLSAYAHTKDQVFLTKATDLGERLMAAFDTPTGIPNSDVNLLTRTSRSPGGVSSTSETSTLHLEFCYLSHVTGSSHFCEAVEKASDSLAQEAENKEKQKHLLPIYVNARTGKTSGVISLGARGDSYYEYLLKSWLITGRKDDKLLSRYLNALQAISENLVQRSSPNNLLYIAEMSGNGFLYAKMDHLVCFLPGTVALGVHFGAGGDNEMQMAKDLLETCWQTYARTPTGLGPEIVVFEQKHGHEDFWIKPLDTHNLLRPETAESLFILWRLTHDEKYREYGWKMFESFRTFCRVDSGGYASIDSVLTQRVSFRDKMESFWLAETLKYLFLLFSNDELIPLDRFVFNTEAHPLPIFDRQSFGSSRSFEG